MERYEIETRANDEQTANLVAKVMAGAVVAMALIVMATVLSFHSGGTIV